MNHVSKPEMTLSDAFREAFRHHPAGVAVITTAHEGQPVALMVSSLISVNPQPPTVAFSLSAASSSAEAILQAKTVVIHFLQLRDQPLAQLCASGGADRFGPQVNWDWLPTGEPHYTDVVVWFRASIVNTLPVTGATLIVAELLEGRSAGTPGAALVYLNRRWQGLP